jgi:DNA-binding transcriptional regulator YdaS (Cro superfamily)
VDHPYAMRTRERGEIELAGVATGPLDLLIVSPPEAGQTVSPVRRVAARVAAAETTVVHIDLSTPEAAQDRL